MFKSILRVAVTRMAATLCLVISTPLLAETLKDQGQYKLYLSGIPAGGLAFNAVNDGNTYRIGGKLASTGLVGSVVKVSYDAQSAGLVRGDKLIPTRYSEQANTGRRKQSSSLNYKNGVPQVLEVKPKRKPKKYDADPSKQKGTLDTLTSMYTLLRKVDQKDVCTLNVQTFDGRRRSETRLSKPIVNGNEITCNGVYRRIEGFSPREMRERVNFEFKVVYSKLPTGQYHVTKIFTDTLFGRASLIRQ
ncbi:MULTISPECIES: DUF3108 domain-containing protein [Halocynthiibacter]|uniref:DUF3108 domain-containing protein n=1 Tax=Halocynthiibacter halioticoli TaxID=2986804 RepID=A0AAE3J240_9RHOB|nr:MULTISPECIES: DUF3108 domain-containing protein [Halocynthiibacter]MCV6825218.1 DUF3108 domain-containing protein [Halocynthiibacter halioticoli]MCW4058219.1 DUF3108 domain-containing protein [Halocynthiibacter sp. SDUM655004]